MSSPVQDCGRRRRPEHGRQLGVKGEVQQSARSVKPPRAAITALEREWLKVLRELHPDWLWGYRDGDR
jgi:hypothetical protein